MEFHKQSKKHEADHALRAELEFKALARRNKRLGQWLAKEMGLIDAAADAYVTDVIHSDMEKPGDDDVVAKVMADVAAKGLKLTESDIRAKMDELLATTRAEIRAEAEKKR